jgi:hypothetical protein
MDAANRPSDPARWHSLSVERKPGFRTMPVDELVHGVLIRPVGLYQREAVKAETSFVLKTSFEDGLLCRLPRSCVSPPRTWLELDNRQSIEQRCMRTLSLRATVSTRRRPLCTC